MGDRSYLAIGDVLALLREEFPDVTISKIRFLESRGLLVPERTPSGYRKFYEPDVDRLRWILRQQREHFLPLKVIKGRLENGMSDPEAPAPPLFEMGDLPPDGERESEPALVGAQGAAALEKEGYSAGLAPLTAGVVPAKGLPPRVNAPPNGETTMRSIHTSEAARTSARGDTPNVRHPRSPRSSPEAKAAEAGEATAAGENTSAGDIASSGEQGGPEETTAVRRRRSHRAVPEPEVEAPEPVPQPAATSDTEPGPQQIDTPTSASRDSTRAKARLPGAGVSGASLTVAELAAASGLDVAGVEELESFGLIAGRTVAGVHCYDEEAVAVAKLAAGFAPFGIEARHLRIFKHAADRQTGLFAQVVTPLLRQRNPEARARALSELSELSELGEALMRCFSQATLRDMTGG